MKNIDTKWKVVGTVFVFTILLVSSFLVFRMKAVAQDSVSIKMQPAIIEDLADPGTVFRTTIAVTNLSDSEKLFYLIARDITALSETGTPIFAATGEETPYSLSSWIRFGIPSVTLASGEMREIPVSVFVPRDAEPGGHFAGLFVSLKPPKLTATGTGVGYEVATIISLQVAGDITEDARIREFSTGKLIYTKAEVDFNTVVQNMGNVLVRARGPLEITDIFGKKVATLVVNDQGAVVLPDSNREFKSVWTGEGLSIGRYQAVLGLVYGNNGRKTITATTSFWVLPLNFMLVTLVGIIGFIVIFFTATHLYIRRKLVQMDKAGSGRERAAYAQGHSSSSSKNMVVTIIALVAVAMLIILTMVLLA